MSSTTSPDEPPAEGPQAPATLLSRREAAQLGLTARTIERYARRRGGVSEHALHHLAAALHEAHAETVRAKDELREAYQRQLVAHAAASAERLGRLEAELDALRRRAAAAEARREEMRDLVALATAALYDLRAAREAVERAQDGPLARLGRWWRGA